MKIANLELQGEFYNIQTWFVTKAFSWPKFVQIMKLFLFSVWLNFNLKQVLFSTSFSCFNCPNSTIFVKAYFSNQSHFSLDSFLLSLERGSFEAFSLEACCHTLFPHAFPAQHCIVKVRARYSNQCYCFENATLYIKCIL